MNSNMKVSFQKRLKRIFLKASLACLLLIFIANSGCINTRQGLSPLTRNDLIGLLEQNQWKFISIPTADISPGAIVTVSEEGFKVVGALKDCFPGEVMTNFKPEGPSPAALPDLKRKYAFDAGGSVLFADYFSAGPEFSSIRDFVLEIKDASKYAISEIKLDQKTNEHWKTIDTVCVERFRRMSTQVVTAVLSATDFNLTFKDTNGGALRLSNVNIPNYLSIKVGVDYEETEEGGLRFKKTTSLPFAFQSVGVNVPEPRGRLEIPQESARIPKGESMTSLSLRNSGNADLHWHIGRQPEKGFFFRPEDGSMKIDERHELVIRRTGCVDKNKAYDFSVKVKETDQSVPKHIVVEEECAPQYQYKEARIKDPFGSFAEGVARYRQGDFKGSLDALAKATELNPDLADMPIFKKVAGLAAYKAGDEGRALNYFKSLAKDQKTGHVYAAYLLAAKEDLEEAKEELAKGEKALERDSWVRAEVLSTFNKPVEECRIPPSPKAILYQREIASSVGNVVGLPSQRFRTVFSQEAKRLSDLDPQLTKAFAAAALCGATQSAVPIETSDTVENINSVMRKLSGEKDFDVRPKALLEETEERINRASNLRGNVVEVLTDYVNFISSRLEISHSHLRSNVFMLDRNGVLRIPEGLSFNMYDPEELSIKIPVGFGSTGIAFERQNLTISKFSQQKPVSEPSVTLVWSGNVSEKGKELWESRRIFLPAEEMKKLSQLPTWIISVPVFDPLKGNVLGILNVDCINKISVFGIGDSACDALARIDYGKIEPEVYYWSSKLASLLRET